MSVGDFNFHLRKKNASVYETEKFLVKISPEFYKRIIIHQHFETALHFGLGGIHLPENLRQQLDEFKKTGNKIVSTSVHQLDNLNNIQEDFEYIFYSPVFKSISKNDYFPGMSIDELKLQIERSNSRKLIALGGINKENFNEALQIGFVGVALLGAVWQHKNPVNYFSEFLSAFNGVVR